jgi:NitT/TauT family transport system permease protein
LADTPLSESSRSNVGAGFKPAPAEDVTIQPQAGSAEGLPPINPEPSVWHALTSFRGTTHRVVDVYVGILGVAMFVLAWQLAAELMPPESRHLPSPRAVVVRLYELLTEHGFAYDIAISLYRIWSAFLIAAVMAIPLGIWMSSYRLVNGLCEPLIDFARYLPVPALVPLTVVWFGIGDTMKIVLLWMGTFFQLVLLVADGARRVPREYIEVGMTVGAKPRAVLTQIVLPAMLPTMVDNLRITLGWCWTYVVVAEIVASNSGVGFVIMSARRYYKTPEIFAGILTIGFIGLFTDQAIRWAHRRYFAYLQ